MTEEDDQVTVKVTVFPDVKIYGVDDQSNVWNIETRVKIKTQMRGGYMRVHLRTASARGSTRSISAQFNVSYIVCRTFHGPKPTPKHTVDHINRIKTDNRPENLRWATRSEQSLNRRAFVHTKPHKLARVHYKHDTVTGEIIATYSSSKDASAAMHADLGNSGRTLVQVMKNISESVRHGGVAYGFRWSADALPRAHPAVDLEDEEWRPVAGDQRMLSISNYGRIRAATVTSYILVHCPTLNPMCTAAGYYQVMIGTQSKGVHQIVADAFLGKLNATCITIRHLDGNKLNNRADNLAYVKRNKRKRVADDIADE